jgi:hypothetical protein
MVISSTVTPNVAHGQKDPGNSGNSRYCDSDTNRIERLSDQVTRCFCIRKEWAEGLVGVFLLFLLDL